MTTRGLIKINPLYDWTRDDAVAFTQRPQRAGQRAARPRLPLHRLRALHPRHRTGRAGTRRPLVVGRATARPNAACTPTRSHLAARAALKAEQLMNDATLTTASAAHSYLDQLEAESIHIMRETVAECDKTGDALFDRQGFVGAAASGDEGVLSRQAAVSAAACRHHLEISRDDRVSRPPRQGTRRRSDGAYQSGRRWRAASARSRTARNCIPTS